MSQGVPYVSSSSICLKVFPMLQRFVCLMYNITTNCLNVDQCRRELFIKKGRSMESLPPTSADLYQHALRAAYQAGHVWAQACEKDPVIPPENWDWSKTSTGAYVPFWTDLGEASVSLKCKCVRSNMDYTDMCKCS